MIEALVAVAILLLSITSAFSVAQSSLQSSSYAKNRTTAYYLAQEAVEYIRNVRDKAGLEMLENRTGDIPWTNYFATDDMCDIDASDPCAIDTLNILSPNPQVCDSGTCANMFVLDGEFFRYFDGNENGIWEDSGFRRTIHISSVPGTQNEIRVDVTVSWNQGSVPKEVVVSENLYNWQSLQEL